MSNMSATTRSSTIDIRSLLKRISVKEPAGTSLRYEGTYDRVQEARREDDPRLSQGIYQTQVKQADWAMGAAVCIEALEKRSKDLQIAGWLLEAWLHLDGFRGVESGLSLLKGLCEKFWETLHPNLDGEDVEDRIAPFEWINHKLSLRLKQIPLTLPVETDERGYSYVDWESACHFENLARRDPSALQEALATIDPTVATLQNAFTLSDISFHAGVVADLDAAVKACAELQTVLDEKCGTQSPSLYQFHEVLSAIQQFMSQSLQARQGALGIEPQSDAVPAVQSAQTEIQLLTGGPIRSRADAYRRLAEAAEYLLRTEPHSPTPYLVKRAVDWGHMNLFEVYQQIVRNEGELEELDRLLRLSGKKAAAITE